MPYFGQTLKPWTSLELKALRKAFAARTKPHSYHMSMAVKASILGSRTYDAIDRKARRMGFHR